MQEIKNAVKAMKHVFDRLISKANMAEERISQLKDMSIESLENEQQIDKE